MSSAKVAATLTVPTNLTAPWNTQKPIENRQGGLATPVSTLTGMAAVKPRLACLVMVTGSAPLACATVALEKPR